MCIRDRIWYGPTNLFYVEDPKFGLYLGNRSDGAGCAQLDGFLATNATQHLMVYSAGNDRSSGPGHATNYYMPGSNKYHWIPVLNPSPGERDWQNGDDDTYGFDTMAAPGTAKNVLTVGSVLDVFHDIGEESFMGYATNSPIGLSGFSAAGPTDDGRIKPDIMAVGEAHPWVRNFPLLTSGVANDMDVQGQSGTSFAAPGVTAGLGLVLQRRSQLFPNLDAETEDYRGSTMKATAIHTADDLWNPGPDYRTGWGLFNACLLYTSRLARFPKSGARIQEIPHLPHRQMVVPPCRIFYRLEGKDILIVSVMRGEQQLREIALRERG